MAGAGRLNPSAASLLERVGGSLPPGPAAVALSGGADSAVCAWLAREAGLPVRAITVDHGLPASAALVAAATAIAGRLGIDQAVVAVDAAAADEATLRDARYAAVELAARPDEALLSGHTADDLAETTLGNLVRGAGAAGLAGIPASRGRWHRPLLGVRRSETRAAAVELGLPFADDPGNTDPALRRSFIRTEVMPMLERLNPSVADALVRAARLAADDDAALGARAAAVPVVAAPGEVRLAAAALAAVPRAVAARAVRRGLRHLLDPYAGGSEDVAAVLEAAAGAGQRSLARGLLAVREGPWITVYDPAAAVVPDSVPLPVPGEAAFGAWRIVAAPGRTRHGASRHTVALAAGAGPLEVRAARPGDTIAMGHGSKSVSEAMREAGVPPRLRPAWPVVAAAGTMVWVVGCRVAAGAAAGPGEPAVVVRASEVR